jgi:2-polyprenyl-3-methyl-5-hydroxy-6-metoxy-1,4-benzoquinol methylase
MTKVADRIAGFDWSQPGLEILHKHGVNGLHRLNLLEPDEVEKGWNNLGFEPEIVVAGELLEHLDRAGMVLENCQRMMAPGCQMVITVPNAFSVRSLLHVLRGYEKVAPDHVSYYSYSNVRELAERNGFTLDRVNWYRYSPTRKAIDRVVDMGLAPVLWMWPQLSEGLIAECSLANEA